MNTKRSLEPLIYAYNIPKDLLDSLEPVDKDTASEEVLLLQQQQSHDVNALALERLQIQQDRLNNQNGGTLTCNTCAISFEGRDEQRTHFNTDWHRYNIKRRVVLDVKPVTFEEFEVLLGDLTESISGSESEEDDVDEEEAEEKEEEQDSQQDSIQSLVEKQKKEQEELELLANDAKGITLPMMKKYSALNWYKQRDIKDSIHYGIYRHLINNQLNNTTLESIQQQQGKKRTWTIIMLGGGHFAGCVIDVTNSKGPAEKSVDKQVKIITHKTFHRYTTRRKQGGSQSTNDNAKGAANSAGAQIRRYNEQMLQQEVRAILSQWRQHIESSELVLVHAPSGNRKVIYNYEGAVLNMQHVKSIPFVTRRPTLNELKRVFLEMTTVKMIQVDQEAIEEYRRKWIENQEKLKKQLEKATTVKLKQVVAAENNVVVDPILEKLMGLIKQNKTTVTSTYLEKHMNLPTSGLLPMDQLQETEDLYHYPTLLHMIANAGAHDLVTELLIKYDADPTIISEAGKTAYEVSKDKETRNAFRRCMSDYPQKWAWLEEGRVPSPLTQNQLEEQQKKDAKKMAKEQEKKRLIELERAKLEAAKEEKEQQSKLEKTNKTRATKGLLPIVTQLGNGIESINNMANMTPEARMRLEREKRARAAEERMKRA